jgi:hypothetical protein
MQWENRGMEKHRNNVDRGVWNVEIYNTGFPKHDMWFREIYFIVTNIYHDNIKFYN